MTISVLVLTKNEEKDLPGCLATLNWSDDVHVYDSLSSDETQSIAKEFGAHVTTRPFDNWAAHQNWGLKNIHFKHQWVYYSDADERLTPELVAEMRAAVSSISPYVAYRVRRRDYFQGRWLKHVTPSPFNIRLFRPDCISYERLTNPITKVSGEVGDLIGHFNHYPFSKGMRHWVEKHNSYSDFEASQIIENQRLRQGFSWTAAFFDKDKNTRRYHQKELYYRAPLRPVLMFFLLYIFRAGFLDGAAGFRYAVLRAFYEFLISLKVEELEAGSPLK